MSGGWLKDHKKEVGAAAAVAAAIAAPYAIPALGTAMGIGAGAAGASGAAGATGAGLLKTGGAVGFGSAIGGTGATFGPTAAQTGLLSLGGPAAATPFITEAPAAFMVEPSAMGMPGFAGSIGTEGASLGSRFEGALANGKLEKALRFAGVSQSLLGGDQQQPIRPQGKPGIARPQPLELPSFWTDPQEEEKKRQMAMLMMQQQGGYYG